MPHSDQHQELITLPEHRRFGFWHKLGGGALTFAILVHVIVLLIGAIWIFQVIRQPEKKIDFMPGGGGGGERGASTKVATKKRAQITPSTNVKRVFAEGAESNYQLPDPGDQFGEMSKLSSLSGGMSSGLGGAGSGKGFGKGSGDGMGNGKGMGKVFGLIPETMAKRCSKDDRLVRLTDNGGTAACDEAVVKGLRWLKANQNPDGSWGMSNGRGGTANATAMTGLALLAFFGHCETPISEEFGDTTLKGIVFLVNTGMKNNGKLGDPAKAMDYCYEHAIATYALAEAQTLCKDIKPVIPNLRDVTAKAGQLIIASQHSSGGWAYGYLTTAGHADTSITGWQIQALKACSHTGITFAGIQSSAKKGIDYVNSCQNDNGGFGYVNNKAPAGKETFFTLTGVGMLCNQMWGKHGREVANGAKYVLANAKFDYTGPDANLYAHYYISQAMMQCGGMQWSKYNEVFRDQVLNNQDADGSWKPPGGKDARTKANKVYRTCLNILMLEVYYRFLSTGNSGGGGGASKLSPRI